MNRVVHFEIQADEPERAADFYRKIFDWKIDKYEELGWDYWIVMTAEKDSKEPGIHGGLLKRPAGRPSNECGANSFVCTIVVENFDRTAEKNVASGGVASTPKFAIPGMAWQGYFHDTEGNIFGIHEADTNAK